MTTDPVDQPQQSTADRPTTTSVSAPSDRSSMVIGTIVVALLVGGFYLASRIANTEEAPQKASRPIVARAKPDADSYISAEGHLESGATLYDKETKQPWGTIAGVPDAQQIEVLRINNMALGNDRTRGIPALYDRSYITSNFVVKNSVRGR